MRIKTISLMSLIFGLIVLWGCQKAQKIGDIYQVEQAKYILQTWSILKEINYVWIIESKSQTMLGSPIGGKIISIKVEEWDYVKWGWLLAEVDPSVVATNLKSASDILTTLQAMYQSTEAMFDAQIKAMEEKVNQAKAGMEMALKALEWTTKWLKDTQNITKEQLETAKKQVEQAKIWVETSKTNLEHTKKVLTQKEKDIYSNSKNALAQARIVATNFLDFVDQLVGISDKNKSKNDAFEVYLWAKNTALKEKIKNEWRQIYNNYSDWKSKVDKLIEDVKNSPDVTADENLKQRIYDQLKKTETLFVSLRSLADDVYRLVDSSVSSPTFPEQMINQYKHQATTFQNMIEQTLLTAQGNYLLGIKGSIQAIENFKKESKMQLDLLQKQYEMAKKQYETAKQTYKQYLAMSEWKVDEIVTKKEVAEKQYEIAKKQYDEALKGLEALKKQKETQLSQIRSQIARVRWNKNQAAIQLSYTKVIAPYDWVVVKKMADIWQVVGPWMPIFALADDRELKIKVYVPASSANKLELGKNVKIYVSSLEQWFTGQISKIYPMVDFMSKRVPVEIKIENPTHKLKIWMYADVYFDLAEAKGLMIPKDFVKYKWWQPYIVVDSKQWTKEVNINIVWCNEIQCVITWSWLNVGEVIVR